MRAAVAVGVIAGSTSTAWAQYELNIAGAVKVQNSPANSADGLLDFSQFVGAVETTTLPGVLPFPTNIPGTAGLMNDVTIGDPGVGRPLCVSCPVNPLLVISGYSFTLTNLTPGTPPADVIFGPVELNRAGTLGTAATMSGFGTVTGGVFGVTSRPFTVSFHASFTRDTPAGLLAAINGGASRNVAFGADILISAVPEPTTVLLTGVGLLALLGAGLRRRTTV